MTISDVLLIRIERAVRRHQLFRPDDTLVVAFSGGADSTALLDLLSRLPGYRLRLIAAHVNHCLRGAESDGDEAFCREMAGRYGIPFETLRCDVRNLASVERLNLEDAARHVRIDFFDEISNRYGAAAVVLAHHADDQAETVLMRLLRGSGMTGLSGMAYRNARDYIRPLLEISRTEIEQYLLRRGLAWCEDASNSDTAYLRNRIRHELLPLLEEYNPAIRSTLAATASVIRDDEALLGELTADVIAESCQIVEGKVICRVGELRALDAALRRRVLRHAFKLLTGTLEGVSQRHIEALCDLIDSERPNVRLSLPHAVTAMRAYDALSLMRTCIEVPEACFELMIPGPGRYPLPSGGVITVDAHCLSTLSSEPESAHFDSAKVPFPWLVRTFRSGDRMMPFGMSGRKKVKDIFIDKKIPLTERAHIPFLLCGDELVWIAGVCASELGRVDATSTATVRVTWHYQVQEVEAEPGEWSSANPGV